MYSYAESCCGVRQACNPPVSPKYVEKLMNTPKCHRCGADLVQIKLTEDSEVGWYCVGCDSDLIAEIEEAPTKIDD